ncbi:hypothetical protein [Chroogloeocystis siderophila]|uniref:hypothetical protein n=1 Tax=Chroogloeocystis siderophila TaxID=329163 RepID=UPI001C49DD80|nr:hypothetical protein [Chroogloeocystis siderophila]
MITILSTLINLQKFRLQNDPHEFNNLAGKLEYQNIQNLLLDELLNWRQQTADPLLDPAVLAAMVKAHYGRKK